MLKENHGGKKKKVKRKPKASYANKVKSHLKNGIMKEQVTDLK